MRCVVVRMLPPRIRAFGPRDKWKSMGSRSRAGKALTPPTASPWRSMWAARRFMLGPSLSRFQAVVGTLAGIVSIAGAAFSLMEFVRPANTGNLVVQAAGVRGSVTDATIEVLTTQDAIVATLTPDSTRS